MTGRSSLAALVALLTSAPLGCVDSSAGRDAYVYPEPDTTVADTHVADAAGDDTAGVGDAHDDAADVVDPALPPESASLASLWSGAARWAAPLGGGATLIVDADGAWWWLDSGGARLVVAEGELEIPKDTPAAAAPLAAGVDLIAVRGTLYRLDDGVLGVTPLSDALDAEEITDLATPDGATLWIATDAGLWRWRDGVLAAVPVGSASAAGARLACGAPVDGRPAVWVVTGDGVFAVTSDGDGLAIWPEQPELAAVGVGADGHGVLWVLDDAGGVSRRTPDAIWRAVELPEPVVALTARADSPHVWIRGESGGLYHAVGDDLSEVTNAPDGDLASPPDDVGAALVVSATGIVQIAPGRIVNVVGVKAGATLSEPTTVTVRPSEPGEVVAVTATLDGGDVEVAAVGEADERVWQLLIDPPALVNGGHRVGVEVSWEDATLTSGLSFEVAFPTWSGTVEPLYQKRCSACHDAVIGAATVVLDEMSAWTSQVDCIICRVSAPFDPALAECMMCASAPSSMPPTGALPDHEIDLVRGWRAGGLRP